LLSWFDLKQTAKVFHSFATFPDVRIQPAPNETIHLLVGQRSVAIGILFNQCAFCVRDFLELTKSCVPTSRPAISLPPKSVISFVLTEKVPKCPDAGSGWRFYSTVPSPPPDLNNL
jgi:hypothetical protein